MEKLFNTIGTIVILILLVLNITLFTQNKNLKKETSVLNARMVDLEKQKRELDIIPEGWSKHISEKNKFYILYPKVVKGYEVHDFEFYSNHDKANIVDFSADFDNPPQKLLTIYIYNKNTLNIKDFIRNDVKGSIKKDINNIDQYINQTKINNINSYKLETKNDFVRYYIEKDNLIFVLRFDGYMLLREIADELKPVFNQMVQSFRFID